MKVLFYIFIFFIVSCKTQEKITVELNANRVLLNPTILPNTIYYSSVLTDNNSVVEYVGNQDIIEGFKTSGIDYPIVSNSISLIESTMKTGKVDASGGFSVKSTYDKVEEKLTGSMAKIKESIGILKQFEGIQTFGRINDQMRISIDSIVGLKNESLRSTIEQGMKSILNQIVYPKEYVQVGNSFTINTPVAVPVFGGEIMDMVIEDKYFLDSISNAVAYFSIDQKITIGNVDQEGDIVLNGEGKGKIEYDIINQINQYYYSEIKMNTNVDVNGLGVKTTSINKTTVKTKTVKK